MFIYQVLNWKPHTHFEADMITEIRKLIFT